MQQTITTQQLVILNCLIHKLGLTAHKQTMVEGASNGRASSSKELSVAEATALIKQLKVQELAVDVNQQKIQKMRNKIFYYAHEMGITKINAQGKMVADVKRIDEWMLSHSYLKKKLNAYKYNELPKLVSQYEMVYKSFLKAI